MLAVTSAGDCASCLPSDVRVAVQNWGGGFACVDLKSLCLGNGDVMLVYGSWSYLVRCALAPLSCSVLRCR